VRLFVAVYPPPAAVEHLAALVEQLSIGRPREPGASVRLVPPPRWHVTLAFLGDVPDDREPEACEALRAAARRWQDDAGGARGDGARGDAGARGGAGRGAGPWSGAGRGAGARGGAGRGAGARDARSEADAGGHARRLPERLPPRLWIGGGGRFGTGRSTTLWTGIRGDTDALAGLAADIRRELRVAKLPFDAKPMRPHITLARPADRLSRDEVDADLAALGRYEGPKWTVAAVELVRSHLGPQVRYDRLATCPFDGG